MPAKSPPVGIERKTSSHYSFLITFESLVVIMVALILHESSVTWWSFLIGAVSGPPAQHSVTTTSGREHFGGHLVAHD